MGSSRTEAINRAKVLVQDDSRGLGSSGLATLLQSSDYDEAVTQALRCLDNDRPNERVVDCAVAASGFRFNLESGTFATLAAGDAWVVGTSQLLEVLWPWDPAVQGLEPVDQNDYRIKLDPGDVQVLEFLADQPQAGETIRLRFTRPHVLAKDAGSPTNTVRDGDFDCFILLVAAFMLRMAAAAAVRNTGTTGLPGDVVDRRSQSDLFKARADEYAKRYREGMGLSGADATPAMDAIDLDVQSGSGRGFMFHSTRSR